jgi:predicted DCC family thiol-disulfide oxidoreductase YuxK
MRMAETDMPDKHDAEALRGWVLYDADCSFCTDLIARARKALESGGFRPEPLQSVWVRERLNPPEDLLLAEMRVLTRAGRVMGGADALVYLASELSNRSGPWWLKLVVLASKLPFGMWTLRRGYRDVAARRYCRQGRCPVVKQP